MAISAAKSSAYAANPQEQMEGTQLVVGAACIFALVALVVKKDPLPLLLATECRFLVSWVVAIAFMLAYRKQRGLHWFGPPALRKWLVLKCAMSFTFIVLWWTALRRAPVGDCIAIIYTSPVLTSLISRFTLGETLPREFPLQVALVSVGMVLVLNPPLIHSFFSSEEASPQHDYTFVFLALAACAIVPIVTRKAKDCSWIEVEHVNACLACVVLTPALSIAQYLYEGGSMTEIKMGFPPSVSYGEVGLIFLASAGSFVGIAMETKGYQLADVGKASMFRYVEVPFAYVLQHFGTDEPVETQALLGSIFIIASCFLGLNLAREPEDSKAETLLEA